MENQLEMMEQLEMLEEKLTTGRITRGKGSRSPSRERVPTYISWAATNAIALELAEAHELLRDPQESHSNCGALPPPRKGPTTPPLLQRPLAVDSDEESIWRGRSTQADVLSAPRLRKRGKSVGKRKRGSAEVVNEHGAHTKRSPSARQRTDSAEIRKDALERSVEAIESLSLALDYVNEEKKVLLRVLEACETSGFAVNKALHSETLDGSSRLAQASFIAQMLPGVDSKVVERMSAKAISKNLCHSSPFSPFCFSAAWRACSATDDDDGAESATHGRCDGRNIVRQLGACYDLSHARANRRHILTNTSSNRGYRVGVAAQAGSRPRHRQNRRARTARAKGRWRVVTTDARTDSPGCHSFSSRRCAHSRAPSIATYVAVRLILSVFVSCSLSLAVEHSDYEQTWSRFGLKMSSCVSTFWHQRRWCRVCIHKHALHCH